jgi:SMODS and SLOG-associating 2TM effector domain 1
MSERSQQALELYRAARVRDQLSYYGATAAEYERASAQSAAVAALLLSVTTLAAALAGLDVTGKSAWAVVAVIVPAVSTALAAYEALFGFERMAKLYGDAVRSIKRLDEPHLGTTEEVAAYVTAVETIFHNEQSQWGQLATRATAHQDHDQA